MYIYVFIRLWPMVNNITYFNKKIENNRTVLFYYNLFTIGSLIYTPRYHVIPSQEITHYATHTTDQI